MKLTLISVLTVSLMVGGCRDGHRDDRRKPADNRFSIEALAVNLDEPMQMDFMPDGRILFVERKGRIRIYQPNSGEIVTIGTIPVSIGYYDEDGTVLQPTGEDGMQGAILDPDFKTNRWVYLYYSPEGKGHHSILARYEIRDDRLINESKRVLLEVPNQRKSCCHLGGGMIFDRQGNLYLSTGDNTPNDTRGYSPIDEREGRSMHDAQRSSGNTNDFRGKILRIHPKDDGTYSIPQGNLFPAGTEGTKPEIYTMGNRNPWRLSIDSKTGWLFWGEVGPAGVRDSLGMGPKSYDEFNIAKGPGNFGWPYLLADNKAYWRYDYQKKESVYQFDAKQVRNLSPNNTGLESLPTAIPAIIWYPQMRSEEFPLMGSGSNSAVGGPVYRYDDFAGAERPFPKYYDGKWLITDWTRGWIFAVTLNDSGEYVSMEPFLGNIKFNGPIDMKFGPGGDLYVLEYGRGTYKKNAEARLVRVKYHSGNRHPVARIEADKEAGAVPFEVGLSAAGSEDYDGDPLTYHWDLLWGDRVVGTQQGREVSFSLEEGGVYRARLAVSDPHGEQDTAVLTIQAGNEPPVVDLDFRGPNQTFYFPGTAASYSVVVTDKEDGASEGGVAYDSLRINAEYVSLQKYLLMKSELNPANVLDPVQKIIGEGLIQRSDCQSCHLEREKLMGPSYRDIAKRYRGMTGAKDRLIEKVAGGSKGSWGNEVIMPPHPDMSGDDIAEIVDYILNHATPPSTKLPPSGELYDVIGTPPEGADYGILMRVSYTDKGFDSIPALTGYRYAFLRNPYIPAYQMDSYGGVEVNHEINQNSTTIYPLKDGAYISLGSIDMTGITNVRVKLRSSNPGNVINEGSIEIRTGGVDGVLLGHNRQTGTTDTFFWVDIPLRSIEGKKDIFIVLDKANAEPAIQLNGIMFESKRPVR